MLPHENVLIALEMLHEHLTRTINLQKTGDEKQHENNVFRTVVRLHDLNDQITRLQKRLNDKH